MKLNFASFLEILFPLSADERCLAECKTEEFAQKLLVLHMHDIQALASFKDPHMRSALHLAKFHNNKRAILLLSMLLKKWLSVQHGREYLLIPIPLSRQRMRERGHNQVTSIAEPAVKGLNHIHLQTHLLLKRKNARPQATLSREERQHNLTGAYMLKETGAEKIRGKHIILLDDVTTTGTTLKEAAEIIKSAEPASLLCVAIAH